MLFKSIQLTNFLSYGQESRPVELLPLNVLIGPNGSGKSNFIEAFEVLQAAPSDLFMPIRAGGGVRNWLWQGDSSAASPKATIEAVIDDRDQPWHSSRDLGPLRYVLGFGAGGAGIPTVVDERLVRPASNYDTPFTYYDFQDGKPVVNVLGLPEARADAVAEPSRSEARCLQRIGPEAMQHAKSALSQCKGPQYPELTWLGDAFSSIRTYREWSFGRHSPLRQPQRADLPCAHLEPDASNLYMVLSRMQGEPEVKAQLLKALNALYEGLDDFHVEVAAGHVQVVFHEGRRKIPATRLSDGALRYLCLLAILCDPHPGPLLCIEEPELGLHPDVLSTLADLIRAAAERTQVIITTHSDFLLDCFTETPEAVLVAEMSEGSTQLERLNAEEVHSWLEECQLQLGGYWMSGGIGGTRW